MEEYSSMDRRKEKKEENIMKKRTIKVKDRWWKAVTLLKLR